MEAGERKEHCGPGAPLLHCMAGWNLKKIDSANRPTKAWSSVNGQDL